MECGRRDVGRGGYRGLCGHADRRANAAQAAARDSNYCRAGVDYGLCAGSVPEGVSEDLFLLSFQLSLQTKRPLEPNVLAVDVRLSP